MLVFTLSQVRSTTVHIHKWDRRPMTHTINLRQAQFANSYTSTFAVHSCMYKRDAKTHEAVLTYHTTEAIFTKFWLNQHLVKLLPSPFTGLEDANIYHRSCWAQKAFRAPWMPLDPANSSSIQADSIVLQETPMPGIVLPSVVLDQLTWGKQKLNSSFLKMW